MNRIKPKTNINIFEKITAFFMSVVIALTSMPIALSTSADTPRAVSGVGVYNHSYKPDNTVPTPKRDFLLKKRSG